jgi:hypothetical protein
MTSPDLEIHIEEIVLHGFDGHSGVLPQSMDRSRIGAAVQSELARLFADRGVPAGLIHGGEVASLDGGEFHVAAGSRAQGIGAQIAQAVYEGLAR